MNLILGGTSGLGREIARYLQEQGEETFVIGRSYSASEYGQGTVLNLADRQEVAAFDAKLEQELGEKALKRFFWVAGSGYVGDFAEQVDPQRMADVNFANVIPLAQCIWRRLMQGEQESSFVVVSSTTGTRARKDEALYAATKHAQVGFTRSLGLESERLDSSVRVALFMPGGMQTPFWEGTPLPEGTFEGFLDPAKVAAKICERVIGQDGHFYEETFERGSL